ncbi:peptidase family M1-domain-containing protein [Amylocystis lapponica]|nr:peptidase family M1-domain-containing protein [Amylocystis lapponica]
MLSSKKPKPVPTSDPSPHRLPADVRPTHYDLLIQTDLDKSTFSGVVDIDLDCLKETPTIVLNAVDLNFGKLTLYSEALQTEQVPISCTFDPATGRVALTFHKSLPAESKAQLKIYFHAELTSSLKGYYRSVQRDSVSKPYSLTQFQATHARRAFPCWDEPALKATFAVTLVSRPDVVNISNMPVASETNNRPLPLSDSMDDWKITRFELSPPMSTYLVAFATVPYVYVESSYKSGLSGTVRPLRVYSMSLCLFFSTVSQDLPHAKFVLDAKAEALPLYEKLLGVEFALPKLDTLVVNDFDAAPHGMKGLITGRTNTFLVDPERADLAVEKAVTQTQTHEVGHMWFGNITTTEWWNKLYLNEVRGPICGPMFCPIRFPRTHPEWNNDMAFTLKLQTALLADSKLSSHPVEIEQLDPRQISQARTKAASHAVAGLFCDSVLRMLMHYIGRDQFIKGISSYLKQHLYGNITTQDLWDALEEATGMLGLDKISVMMDTWITKMGFPMITVTETCDGIHVRQDRFIDIGPAEPKDNETIWTIPLNLVTITEDAAANVNAVLLAEREKFIPLDTSKMYKLNVDTVGFYRVLYPAARLAAIGAEAARAHTVFSAQDRQGLMYDAVAFAKAGFSRVDGVLDLIDSWRDEQQYSVWQCLSASLSEVASTWWEHSEVVTPLNGFRRVRLFGPLVDRLGFQHGNDDPADTRFLRTLAISQAADAGEARVVEELAGRFAHYIKTDDDSKISPDLMGVTFAVAIRHGGRQEWAAVKQIAQKPNNPAVGAAAMRALGNTRDMRLAQETMQYALQMPLLKTSSTSSPDCGPTSRLGFLAAAFKEHFDEVGSQRIINAIRI